MVLPTFVWQDTLTFWKLSIVSAAAICYSGSSIMDAWIISKFSFLLCLWTQHFYLVKSSLSFFTASYDAKFHCQALLLFWLLLNLSLQYLASLQTSQHLLGDFSNKFEIAKSIYVYQNLPSCPNILSFKSFFGCLVVFQVFLLLQVLHICRLQRLLFNSCTFSCQYKYWDRHTFQLLE